MKVALKTKSGPADPITAALAGGVKPVFLRVAAHEVGHGIVWRRGGIPIDKMVIQTGIFGGFSEAWCRRSSWWTMNAGNANAFLVGSMAGAAAEQRFLTRYLGWGDGRARREARRGAAWDIEENERLGPAYSSRLTVNTAWAEAAAILAGHEALLDTLTVQLARDKRLPGRAL